MTEVVDAPEAEAPEEEETLLDQLGPEPPDEEEPLSPPQTKDEPTSLAEHGANISTEEEAKDDDDDVLDLTSIIPPRKLVRLPTRSNPKGEVYELRLLDDFGIEEQQQLLSWSRRFEALWNKEDKDLSPRERVKLKWLLNAMFIKVLDAPDEVKRDIDDTVKSRVVTAFTMVPLLERQKREAEEAREKEEREEMGSDSSDSNLPTTAS